MKKFVAEVVALVAVAGVVALTLVDEWRLVAIEVAMKAAPDLCKTAVAAAGGVLFVWLIKDTLRQYLYGGWTVQGAGGKWKFPWTAPADLDLVEALLWGNPLKAKTMLGSAFSGGGFVEIALGEPCDENPAGVSAPGLVINWAEKRVVMTFPIPAPPPTPKPLPEVLAVSNLLAGMATRQEIFAAAIFRHLSELEDLLAEPAAPRLLLPSPDLIAALASLKGLVERLEADGGMNGRR